MSFALFCHDFPLWHKNLYSAELTAENTLRFSSELSAREHRLLAYEKGIRPEFLRSKPVSATYLENDHDLDRAFAKALSALKSRGKHGFHGPAPNDLHNLLQKSYLAKVLQLSRRRLDIDLGGYSLEEYHKCFSALLSIAGPREHICYEWRRHTGKWPMNNLLIIQHRAAWSLQLENLSGLPAQTVTSIISDLTLLSPGAHDKGLTAQPFFPLDDYARYLALVPGFVLTGNAEENILRNSIVSRPSTYNKISSSKEEELINQLKQELPYVKVHGPLNLKKGMPNIDVCFEDERDNSLLICEIKWLLMPSSWDARQARTNELRKGAGQIAFIRNFLNSNPDYLVKTGRMTRGLGSFASVFYCVFSHDFFTEVPAEDRLYSLQPFITAIKQGLTLTQAITYLASDEWLPKHGIDFQLDLIAHACNGVVVEHELFAPSYLTPLNLQQNGQ